MQEATGRLGREEGEGRANRSWLVLWVMGVEERRRNGRHSLGEKGPAGGEGGGEGVLLLLRSPEDRRCRRRAAAWGRRLLRMTESDSLKNPVVGWDD